MGHVMGSTTSLRWLQCLLGARELSRPQPGTAVQNLNRKERLIHSIEDRVSLPPFPCSRARDRPTDQQPPLPFPLTPAPPASIADRSLLQVVRRFVRSFCSDSVLFRRRRLQLRSPDRRLIRRVRERGGGTFTLPPSICRPLNRAPLRNNNKAPQLQSKSHFSD